MTEKDLTSGKILLINKDQGWSSFDVVNKIRGAIKKKFSIKKMDKTFE